MPQKLLETVLRLDSNGDIAGIQQYVVENRYGVPQIAIILPHLLNQGRIRAAYILAMMIDRVGHQDCGVAMAFAAGGLLFNKPEDEARGLKMLQVQTDAQTAPQQTFMDEHVIPKVLITLLQTILPLSDDKLVVRVIEILRAASPQYRAVFDWNAPVADLSLAALRQRGREQTRLTISPRLPVGTPRVRRRVFLMAPVQDYLDQLSVAMNRYGWEVETWHRNHTDAAASEDASRYLGNLPTKKYGHSVPHGRFFCQARGWDEDVQRDEAAIIATQSISQNIWCVGRCQSDLRAEQGLSGNDSKLF